MTTSDSNLRTRLWALVETWRQLAQSTNPRARQFADATEQCARDLEVVLSTADLGNEDTQPIPRVPPARPTDREAGA